MDLCATNSLAIGEAVETGGTLLKNLNQWCIISVMELEQRAMEIIERAEKEIAALASEAAAERDYARASMLLALAQRTRDAARPIAAASNPAKGNGAVAPAEQSTLAASTSRPSALPPTPARSSNRVGYPHFKREGDNLVKVGWSKSDRATYEHRSPRSVVERLVERVKQAGATGHRFTTEELMPLQDQSGAELPSYQAYLCLAWLVAAGLLERHGRQGYTIPKAEDLDRDLDAAWSALPAR